MPRMQCSFGCNRPVGRFGYLGPLCACKGSDGEAAGLMPLPAPAPAPAPRAKRLKAELAPAAEETSARSPASEPSQAERAPVAEESSTGLPVSEASQDPRKRDLDFMRQLCQDLVSLAKEVSPSSCGREMKGPGLLATNARIGLDILARHIKSQQQLESSAPQAICSVKAPGQHVPHALSEQPSTGEASWECTFQAGAPPGAGSALSG
eukprot:TRINITY_DN8552_c0_g2_i4.p1 TRINITY_DN8552_c0_g2~~TRINITY_DN8552_c0_g2_i4.p1  ORF type:complete len:208 (-),score=41.45 TRINITY_DN8552_c0_g2_i4:405-1028(-)